MAENENVEPTPQIEGLPSPQISGKGGQAQEQAGRTAVDFSVLEKDPNFEAFLDKKIQSLKDSRLGSYGTRLETLEAAISKYEALKGGTVDNNVLSKMVGEQELADMKQQLAELRGNKPQSSEGSGDKGWVARQDTILAQAGIDKKDARIADLLRSRTFKDYGEYTEVLEAETFKWMQADAKKPVPSSTTVAQTIPSVPAGSGEYTAEKYKQDMLAARGKPDLLKNIKAKARADGVDVDNIGFI